MTIQFRSKPRIPLLLLLSWILLSWFPEVMSSAVVRLDSIEIFSTHEWLKNEPTVYFHCKGENKTELPDVKKKHVLYTFKGEESWQPMTHFEKKKCKRCGFYEKDFMKADDVFDEWELCPSDFTAPHGMYVHFKDKELNATFLCPDCASLGGGSDDATTTDEGKRLHWAVVIGIVLLVLFVLLLGAFAGYKYWKKRKREQEQARFLKLFEEGDDDMEEELGIGPLTSGI